MIEDYIWKKDKIMIDSQTSYQEPVKMVEMSEEELQAAYNHCKNMLYNDNKKSPGRYIVLNEVTHQIMTCNAELAVRWFCKFTNNLNQPVYTRFTLINEINSFIETNQISDKDVQKLTLKDVYSGISVDFNNVPVSIVLKACKDVLGKFNVTRLNKKFITSFGIWFTPAEKKTFQENEGIYNTEDQLILVKKLLKLPLDTVIPFKSTGLNYTEFRSMINLYKDKNKKYSELTTCQLETLRNKVLFKLIDKIKMQIKTWESLMAQIVEVCEKKGIKLK